MSYAQGYRNGRADRLLGLRLNVALMSNDTAYAQGYRDGNAQESAPLMLDSDQAAVSKIERSRMGRER